MELDDLYKFIGYSVVVLFFIYLISKAMRINARVIEGLTGRNRTSSQAQAQAQAQA
jgi:hypothetical protein